MAQHNRSISQKAYDRMSAEDRELWELREQAARQDEHMNEVMTRGAILEAIETASYSFSEDSVSRDIFAILKKVFE